MELYVEEIASIYRIWYCPRFQASTVGLRTYPQQKGGQLKVDQILPMSLKYIFFYLSSFLSSVKYDFSILLFLSYQMSC